MRRLMSIGGAILLVAQTPLLPTPALTPPPTPDKDGHFVIGSPYAPAPELTVKDGVPKGAVHEFTMESTDSKIYPGIARAQPGVVVPYTRGKSGQQAGLKRAAVSGTSSPATKPRRANAAAMAR